VDTIGNRRIRALRYPHTIARHWPAVFCALCATAVVAAQQPRFDPIAECPFDNPRLDAPRWDEVAWACECVAAKPGDVDAAIRALRDTLARARAAAPKNPDAASALPHVLCALEQLGAKIPAAELDLPPADATANLRLCLLQRAPDGGPLLFREWKQLEESTAAWEVAGDALALRRMPSFACELFAAPLTLHVVIEPRLARGAEPAPPPGPGEPPDGFPQVPVCSWRRGAVDSVEARRVGSPPGLQRHITRYWLGSASCNKRTADRARLAWLAVLAGEPSPANFASRFELDVDMRRFAALPELFAAARQRADESLRALPAALADRKLVPEAWRTRVLALRIEVEDHRPDAERQAAPLPALR
jgi:hypothetical protein